VSAVRVGAVASVSNRVFLDTQIAFESFHSTFDLLGRTVGSNMCIIGAQAQVNIGSILTGVASLQGDLADSPAVRVSEVVWGYCLGQALNV